MVLYPLTNNYSHSFLRKITMSNLVKKLTFMFAVWLPLTAFGGDTPPYDAGQKSKLQFVRSGETMSIIKATIEVNGWQVGTIGKGETTDALIDPGLTLVKVKSSIAPGQLSFSFTAEKGAEYQFEISDGVGKVEAEQVFGTPPKVNNGKMQQGWGVLKATLVSVKLPKPIETGPVPISSVKADPIPETVSVSAVQTTLSIEDKLRALKHLYEQELISKETFQERQRKVLDEMK
jgi:hypothetical protein